MLLERTVGYEGLRGVAGGGGGNLYNGLYGEAPTKRDAFFRLMVLERVGKSVKGPTGPSR